MSENFEKEVFSKEETEKLNDILKKGENIKLPESLKPENLNITFEALQKKEDAVYRKKAKKEKRQKLSSTKIKKIVFGAAAMAACLGLVVSVIFAALDVTQTKKSLPIGEGKEPAAVQDYSEIEKLFVNYAASYKKLSERYYFEYTVDEEGVTVALPQAGINSDISGSVKPGVGADQETGDNFLSSDKNHGETNEQVAGVSESDIIKNDGKYLYIAMAENANWTDYYSDLEKYEKYINSLSPSTETTEAFVNETQVSPPYNPNQEGENEQKVVTQKPVLEYDCSIKIIEPQKNGQLKNVTAIDVKPDSSMDILCMTVNEIYVSTDKLIAIVNCKLDDVSEKNTVQYGCDCIYYVPYRSVTMAVCYDISDKNSIAEEWRVYQDGSYISSRLIGEQFVMLSSYYVDITEDEEAVKTDCVPRCSAPDGKYTRMNVDDICIMEKINDTRYLVAQTLNINDSSTVKSQAVLGGGDEVYCTTKTLYVSSTQMNSTLPSGISADVFGNITDTQIMKFGIENGDVTYMGKLSVPGEALNQFSMDEYKGYFRIATTVRDKDFNITNRVTVFDETLNKVGEITNIAPNETIKAVRFTGDTGYVVTFEQTDPLFVIDFSDHTAPVIKGELKIPGFSAYLHPVTENLLMGIGVDGDENGQGQGIKISLFDVSDPENPLEVDTLVTEGYQGYNSWKYLNSDAFYNHKALVFDSVEQIMYIPYGIAESKVISGGGYREIEDIYTPGIMAVKIDVANKTLKLQNNYIASLEGDTAVYNFCRATYIEDVIIGFAHNEGVLVSFDKTTAEQKGSVNLIDN